MNEYDIEHKLKEEQKYIDFMSDVLRDRNKDVAFLKVVILVLSVLVLVCVIGVVFVNLYNQHLMKEQSEKSEQRMYDFISQYDFDTEYDFDTGTILNSDSSGNISFRK